MKSATGRNGYRSGLRGKCPIEIKIALSQAVKGGIIIAKIKMEGLITSERVPSAYIVSIYDTEKKQMLWNRADSNIEPSVYDQSAPAASTSKPLLSLWLQEMTENLVMKLMPARVAPMPLCRS